MTTYWELTGLREYVQPCSDERCATEDDNPEHLDCYPDTWAEYMRADSMAGYAGTQTTPNTWHDAGRALPLIMTRWQALEFIDNWHGAIWHDTEISNSTESEYSTDDYSTGRESMDQLFVEKVSL